MNVRIAITAFLTIMILTLEATAISGTHAASGDIGWRIDLYAPRYPHNGMGPNMPSDAFAPDENIQIFAKLTYNGFPIPRYLISFEISGPPNPAQNVTQLYTGQTNDSGITQTPMFRETIFGKWTALATAQVDNDNSINDSLTFEFGWIVQTTSLTIMNRALTNQTVFPRGSEMVVEVNLLNTAMDNRNTTLSLEMYDSLGFNINSARTGISVPANETPTAYQFFLEIPENATNGLASIYVNAYKTMFDLGGIAYCPQLSSSFLIMHRNVAVLQVTPSTLLAFKNESISINVKVRNDGDISESFNVTIYRNDTVIATMAVTNLEPSTERMLTVVWNTAQTEEGQYVIAAVASSVPEGDDPSDNTAISDIIRILQRVHDIEVTDVSPLSYSVYAGQILEINVTIRNKGTQTESTRVFLYYDNVTAGSWNFDQIQAESQKSMALSWDTSNVPEGNYTISAFAVPVEGENSIEDNTRVGGRVRIIASQIRGYFSFNWIDWILLSLFLLMIVLLVMTLFYRRRKAREQKSTSSFDSGWTAWYYGYQLRRESQRSKGHLGNNGER